MKKVAGIKGKKAKNLRNKIYKKYKSCSQEHVLMESWDITAAVYKELKANIS